MLQIHKTAQKMFCMKEEYRAKKVSEDTYVKTEMFYRNPRSF